MLSIVKYTRLRYLFNLFKKNTMYPVLWLIVAGPVMMSIPFAIIPWLLTFLPSTGPIFNSYIVLLILFLELIPYCIYLNVNYFVVGRLIDRSYTVYANIFMFLIGTTRAWVTFNVWFVVEK